MHARLSLALGLATIILPAQAMAAEERAFDVPRASLSTSLPLLSRQGGVSISVSDPALWRTRMRPVRGRMSVDEAIRQLNAAAFGSMKTPTRQKHKTQEKN